MKVVGESCGELWLRIRVALSVVVGYELCCAVSKNAKQRTNICSETARGNTCYTGLHKSQEPRPVQTSVRYNQKFQLYQSY